jgi:hypothetical protein
MEPRDGFGRDFALRPVSKFLINAHRGGVGIRLKPAVIMVGLIRLPRRGAGYSRRQVSAKT